MSGLILLPAMPGQGSGHQVGLNSSKTSAQQLFSALFNGQARLQENLPGHKIPRLPASKSKESEPDKSDNVTQLLALFSPIPTVRPLLTSVNGVAVAAQGSPLLRTSVSAGDITGPLSLNNHPNTLRDLVSQNTDVLSQDKDIWSNAPRSPQQPAKTPSSASGHPARSPLPDKVDGQPRENPVPRAERTPLAQQLSGVAASFAAPHSPVRPSASEFKSDSPPAAPLLASGSETLPRDAIRLVPATGGATPDSPQWQQQLSQQVLIMHHKGIQSAELRLHPQELGNLKISLVIKSDQAEISLISGHSQVRTAIEAALPHLRTALAENGISLGESHVGSDDSASAMFNPSGGFGEQPQDTPRSGQSFSGQALDSPTLLTVERRPSVTSQTGRVDLFV
ncbi:flagellar hook-length control protein FliK [Tatumella sp. UBA2305]|uniref:flagellar hook-length control protein FliK n=1 Tax=Tatumella sp. UBA2305 TaxID=1947647 RepID=UPI0025F0C0A6|nr:flagellar hook-length control protein FliK [Tatumella sp. UBA2305]